MVKRMCSIEVSMSMSMDRYVNDIAKGVGGWLAGVYGLDENEVMDSLSRELNIKIKKEKVVKEKKEKKDLSRKIKSAFPLPFNGEHDESKCQALRQNNGLYTQCQSVRKDGCVFCKGCENMARNSSDGIPEYGTIMQRMAVSPFEYTDPKGRKPTGYMKVMKKYNLTIEQVKEEAEKFGMTILEEHFAEVIDTKRGRPATKPKEVKETKGAKGRPKKEKKVLQIEDEEDLFASLVANANADDESIMSDLSEKSEAKEAKAAEKAAKLEAEKAAKEQEKAEKVAKLEAEKAEKAAKLEAEKAEKAAKLEADKAAKAAAKEQEKATKAAEKAAKEQEKAEKAAKLEADKAAKAAAKEQEKAEKAAKEQEKAEKAAKLEADKAAKAAAKEQEKDKKTKKPVAVEEEEEETYRKCSDTTGKKYIRSEQTNIVYDLDTYNETEELCPVGKWVGGLVIINKKEESDSELSDEEVDEED
jgi:chemotaxis protein histidine kinase CheA